MVRRNFEHLFYPQSCFFTKRVCIENLGRAGAAISVPSVASIPYFPLLGF